MTGAILRGAASRRADHTDEDAPDSPEASDALRSRATCMCMSAVCGVSGESEPVDDAVRVGDNAGMVLEDAVE